MSYIVGNWTVVPRTTDTTSSTKSLAIPDLSYAEDYSLVSAAMNQAVLNNTTGSSLSPVERVRYGRSYRADAYNSGILQELNVPRSQRLMSPEAVNVWSELGFTLKATNSVTGEEVILPMKGSINLLVPTSDIVTDDMLLDLLKRTVSTMFDTGSVDASMVRNLARGDLNPIACCNSSQTSQG